MLDPTQAFFSVTILSKELGIHPNTLRYYIKTGRINAFRIGSGKNSHYRIPGCEIQRIAEMQMIQNKRIVRID